MGVKNNFSQAVSELIGITRVSEIDEKTSSEKDINEGSAYVEDLETIEEQVEEVEEDVTENLEFEEENKVENTEENTIDSENADNDNNVKEEIVEDNVKVSTQPTPLIPQNPSKEKILAMLAQQQQQNQPQNQVPKQQYTPGITTIAKGTVIIGEINAEGDVELLGSVKGKVCSKGDIKANGKIIGDLIGKDIELKACAVQGNIISNGMVTVDGDSVVIGDVKSENICLDGKIKGNVVAEKEAKFQPKAILAGNVTTASIAMSQGAKIQGAVNIPLSEKENEISFDVDLDI